MSIPISPMSPPGNHKWFYQSMIIDWLKENLEDLGSKSMAHHRQTPEYLSTDCGKIGT